MTVFIFSNDKNKKGVSIIQDGFPILDFPIKPYYFSKID